MADYEWDFREDVDTETLYANGLFYGPPKTGKTTGILTSAPGRVLYLNWDLRNSTLEPRKRAKEIGHPMPFEPKMPRRFIRGESPIQNMMAAAVRQAEDGQWDTIVSDHIVEHMRRLLEELTNKTRRPTLDSRGNVWSDIERWCRALCEAPVNFIVVAHEMTEQKGEDLLSVPFVGTKGASVGGMGTKLKSMVDFIAYTGVQEVEGEAEPQYMAQLRPGKGSDGSQRDAGSRFKALMSENYRAVDLTEWFTSVGAHVGQSNTPKMEVAA